VISLKSLCNICGLCILLLVSCFYKSDKTGTADDVTQSLICHTTGADYLITHAEVSCNFLKAGSVLGQNRNKLAGICKAIATIANEKLQMPGQQYDSSLRN
jgi:hypothetical protein